MAYWALAEMVKAQATSSSATWRTASSRVPLAEKRRLAAESARPSFREGEALLAKTA